MFQLSPHIHVSLSERIDRDGVLRGSVLLKPTSGPGRLARMQWIHTQEGEAFPIGDQARKLDEHLRAGEPVAIRHKSLLDAMQCFKQLMQQRQRQLAGGASS